MDRGPQLPTQPAAAGQSLRRRFDLAITEVTIGGHDYQLLRPRNVDDLISEEDFALDERIPYWADCWPSAPACLPNELPVWRGKRERVLSSAAASVW